MPPDLLIIADDLTGANDTGVQFAKYGIETLVSIHSDQCLQSLARDCRVLVVNTESRHLPPAEAFQRVYNAAQQGVQFGISQFYKKTDSTLRGNIGSELAAVLAATDERALYFAPAYPPLHRTTRRGIQYVNNIPLHQTSFAADPLNPMRESDIAALIARQTDTPVLTFDSSVHNGIVVVDAETDEDLQRVAAKLKAKKLLAGSAGFAEFLAQSFCPASRSVAPFALSLPILVVNGSLHETSLQQVAHAAQHGWDVIELVPTVSAEAIVASIRNHQRVVVTTSARQQSHNVAAQLAEVVAAVLKQERIPSLIVFGGDTLAALALVCDWTAFRPHTEFLPGIPLVQLYGRDDLFLLTKAGGFGTQDLLVEIKKKNFRIDHGEHGVHGEGAGTNNIMSP